MVDVWVGVEEGWDGVGFGWVWGTAHSETIHRRYNYIPCALNLRPVQPKYSVIMWQCSQHGAPLSPRTLQSAKSTSRGLSLHALIAQVRPARFVTVISGQLTALQFPVWFIAIIS